MIKMGPWRRYEEGWGSIFRGVCDGKGVGKTGERECTKGGGAFCKYSLPFGLT